jgi:ATP-dependent exoDNAse (exonuclease V) alpha subunit
MTIHKSQGQTLTKAVVDLGKGEKFAGCTFVATSRVRSIHDIVF